MPDLKEYELTFVGKNRLHGPDEITSFIVVASTDPHASNGPVHWFQFLNSDRSPVPFLVLENLFFYNSAGTDFNLGLGERSNINDGMYCFRRDTSDNAYLRCRSTLLQGLMDFLNSSDFSFLVNLCDCVKAYRDYWNEELIPMNAPLQRGPLQGSFFARVDDEKPASDSSFTSASLERCFLYFLS